MQIKILHWNVWFKEKVENILKFIEKINPDFLCLQELIINSNQNVPKIIATKLKMDYNFALAQKFNDGQIQGNAIFSKYPITKNFNFFIATSKNLNSILALRKRGITNLEI
jgi:exonuclease III